MNRIVHRPFAFAVWTVLAACSMGVLLTTGSASAQDAEDAAQGGQPEAQLPLTHLVLFNSGVGYFQRDGTVTGDAELELQFDAKDINDLLKSMVLQDFGGGRVSTVTYTSRDPITRTLKSFAIDLTGNPSLAAILDQARGEEVEVAAPTPVKGTILGIERKKRPMASRGREPSGDDTLVEVEILNLLTDEGLQSVPLEQVQRIEFQNPELDAELRQALAVLATSHDVEKKTVRVHFSGQGERPVRVAYIKESPVWKTSYRLVLRDNETPFLQGWAIVENTTDEDWKGVNLTLVSGRPISFLMDLYQPLYVPRPEVQLELYTSLRPRVYEGALENAKEAALAEQIMKKYSVGDLVIPRGGGGGLGGVGGGFAGGAAPAEADVMRTDRLIALDRGIQSLAQAAEVGELFQYVIDIPVTLPRQQSAMLPIVNQSTEGTKVSIYNQGVHAKHPLNGLRLKNTTGLHLMQGPITVFDGGAYAGDAQIADMPPDSERLVSYALDLDVEVEPLAKSHPQRLVKLRIAKGTLITTHQLREEKTYNVKNRGTKNRQVLVEHPFRADWKLLEPKEPAERARDVYRFAVPVKAGESDKLTIVEQRQLSQSVALTNLDDDTIQIYIRSDVASPQLKEALANVLAMKQELGRTTAQVQRHEQRLAEIDREQARIRENMVRLPQNSALYGRYVKKLTEQEDEIERLRRELETLRDTEARQRQALDEYLLSLEVE